MRKQLSLIIMAPILGLLGLGLVYLSQTIGISQAAQPISQHPVGLEIKPTTHASITALPTQVQSAEALENAETFLEKVKAKKRDEAAKILGKAGWVYKKEQVHTLPNPGGNLLPSGSIIPEDYIVESWFNLDSDGTILESVEVMRDLQGNLIQYGLSKNGENYSPALDLRYQSSPSENKFVVEDAFARGLANNQEYGFKMDLKKQTEKATLSAPALVVLIAGQNFDTPLKVDNYNKSIVRSETRGYYTSDGTLIKMSGVDIAEDGTEFVFTTTTPLILERVKEPPSDVLELLKAYK